MAYLNEPEGEKIEKILKAAHAGKTSLYLSVVNLGEALLYNQRERGAEKANETIFIIEQLPISIVNADVALTIAAAKLKARHSVSYADCFAAALGIQKKQR